MVSGMTLNGRACSLSPYRPNDFNMGDHRRPAPGAAATQHFEIDVERANADASVMSYGLLSQVYAWFGFNADEMPYVNRGQQPHRIDLAQIR
jgi:hypothetical protein